MDSRASSSWASTFRRPISPPPSFRIQTPPSETSTSKEESPSKFTANPVITSAMTASTAVDTAPERRRRRFTPAVTDIARTPTKFSGKSSCTRFGPRCTCVPLTPGPTAPRACSRVLADTRGRHGHEVTWGSRSGQGSAAERSGGPLSAAALDQSAGERHQGVADPARWELGEDLGRLLRRALGQGPGLREGRVIAEQEHQLLQGGVTAEVPVEPLDDLLGA